MGFADRHASARWYQLGSSLFFLVRNLIRQLLSHQLTDSWGLAGVRGSLCPLTWLLGCRSRHPGCAWLFRSWKSLPGPGSLLPGSRSAASRAKCL